MIQKLDYKFYFRVHILHAFLFRLCKNDVSRRNVDTKTYEKFEGPQIARKYLY